jgi:glycosyltransferase involved in cell wall biosynthesis
LVLPNVFPQSAAQESTPTKGTGRALGRPGPDLHLLYIIDDLQVSGAQVHLTRLSKALSSRDYRIEVVSLGKVSDTVRSQLPSTVELRSFRMGSVWDPLFAPSFFRLVRYIRERRPDIVHTYLSTAGVFGLAAARMAGVRTIVTSRRDMGSFRSPRIRRLEAFLSRRYAQRVFCVCQAVAEETHRTERIPRAQLRVLLNGIDARGIVPRAKRTDEAVVNFVMVASMTRPEKGHRELIESMLLACQRTDRSFDLFLVGGGHLRPSLEALARRLGPLGLKDRIRFLGEQREILQILEGMHVLVVPSYTEGLSNATLEAMAKGLPVIATAVDGNLEIVVDGQTGILVPSQDTAALSEALLAYVRDPSLVETHGKNARLRAEAFSIEKMADDYDREYGSLLAPFGGSPPPPTTQ